MFVLLIRNFSIEQCYWTCDENEADETFKCLQEGDFCDGTPTCDDGTDEHNLVCDEASYVLVKL